MTHLLVDPLPELNDPVLITAFAGSNDAGEAATAAVRWLARHLPARRIGGIDPESFHVFSDTRPTVRVANGERRISWPGHDLLVALGQSRRRDLLLLIAREPELRWRSYCDELISFAQRSQASLLVSLGGYRADTPHTRPVPVSGFATSGAWWNLLHDQGVSPSDYHGPSGVVGALHDRCRGAGLASFSLWSAVPMYLPNTANPKAALALLRQLDSLADLHLDLRRLEAAAAYFERQVDEAIKRDRRAGSYVRELERRADAAGTADDHEDSEPLPSAAEIIKDLEDFLRGGASGNP